VMVSMICCVFCHFERNETEEEILFRRLLRSSQ
jgi:hypothetical protein